MVTSRPIAVGIVEDNPEFSRSLCFFLKSLPELKISFCLGTGRQAVDAILSHQPDVALIDIGLPDISGVEVVKAVRRGGSATDLLILSVFDDDGNVFRALKAGATGYIVKTDEGIPG